MNTPLLDLEELTAAVAAELASGYRPSDNGQVRAVPNLRTIRYYTTLGLLDRPAEMHGRRALYGRRHVTQLVAIKRLQAEGLSLIQVQERLAGLSDRALAEIAGLSSEIAESGDSPRPVDRREEFWRQPPAGDPASPEDISGGAVSDLRTFPVQLVGLELAPGVSLLLRPSRELTHQDSRALLEAARPLLRELERRQLSTDSGDHP